MRNTGLGRATQWCLEELVIEARSLSLNIHRNKIGWKGEGRKSTVIWGASRRHVQVNRRRISQERRVNGDDATEQNDKCISA